MIFSDSDSNFTLTLYPMFTNVLLYKFWYQFVCHFWLIHINTINVPVQYMHIFYIHYHIDMITHDLWWTSRWHRLEQVRDIQIMSERLFSHWASQECEQCQCSWTIWYLWNKSLTLHAHVNIFCINFTHVEKPKSFHHSQGILFLEMKLVR